MPYKPYIDAVTSALLEAGKPMEAEKLYEATGDPRDFPIFRSWLSQLVRRRYLLIDKTQMPYTYSLTEKGEEHGDDSEKFRRKKHMMRFQ